MNDDMKSTDPAFAPDSAPAPALTEREKIRRWAAAWREAATAMEALEREELANYDYDAHRPFIVSMVNYAVRNAQPREHSGLVEQQKLFMKVARKLGLGPEGNKNS